MPFPIGGPLEPSLSLTVFQDIWPQHFIERTHTHTHANKHDESQYLLAEVITDLKVTSCKAEEKTRRVNVSNRQQTCANVADDNVIHVAVRFLYITPRSVSTAAVFLAQRVADAMVKETTLATRRIASRLREFIEST